MDRKLFRNIISLTIVLGANYVIPLLTLPYLVTTLGPSSYGILGFSLAFAQYFSLFVDYGFNLSVTRQIAMAESKIKVSEIFWTVMTCKLILTLISMFIFFILINLNDYLYSERKVLFACLLIILGNSLFPMWLFQGKEAMGLSAIATIVSRLLSVPLIFIFVVSSNDAWIVGFITSFTTILGGIFTLIIIYYKQWIQWERISTKLIYEQFRDGWHLFISGAATSLYTTSIPVMLGFISGPIAVGYFVAADKLRQAMQGLISPLSQALYPKIISTYHNNKNEAFRLIRKMIFFQGGITLILSLILFVFSEKLIEILYGKQFNASVTILVILSFCPLLIGLSNVFGIQTMLVLGYKKQFSRILIFSGVCSIIMLLPLVKLFSGNGAAMAVVFSELLVTVLMFIFLYRKKIPIFIRKANEI